MSPRRQTPRRLSPPLIETLEAHGFIAGYREDDPDPFSLILFCKTGNVYVYEGGTGVGVQSTGAADVFIPWSAPADRVVSTAVLAAERLGRWSIEEGHRRFYAALEQVNSEQEPP